MYVCNRKSAGFGRIIMLNQLCLCLHSGATSGRGQRVFRVSILLDFSSILVNHLWPENPLGFGGRRSHVCPALENPES